MGKYKKYFLSHHAKKRLQERSIDEKWLMLVVHQGKTRRENQGTIHRLSRQTAAQYDFPLLPLLVVITKQQTIITAYYEGIVSLSATGAILEKRLKHPRGRRKKRKKVLEYTCIPLSSPV